jgi:hypothetical protein
VKRKRQFEDLSGRQIGNFHVAAFAGISKYGGTQWVCRCICGKLITLRRQQIQNQKTCGCGRVQLHNSHVRVANRLMRYAAWRAKARGLVFTLKLSDILIPEFCPLLGIKIDVNAPRNSPYLPSLDRKDSSQGYTPSNVWVISYRANNLKNNATLSELKQLVRGWEKSCQTLCCI